jgi:hypothetical protein
MPATRTEGVDFSHGTRYRRCIERTADIDMASGPINVRRLAWVGPMTIGTSVLAVSIVRALIVALMPLDSWTGSIMASQEPEVVTGVLVTAAVVIFPIIVTVADDNSWNVSLIFRRVALGVLIVSCIPNIAGPISEGRIADAGMLQLMLLHIVAWAVTVRMLLHTVTVSPAGTPTDGESLPTEEDAQ